MHNLLTRLVRYLTYWAWREEIVFKQHTRLLRVLQPSNEQIETSLLGPPRKKNRKKNWLSRIFPPKEDIRYEIQDMLCNELASLVANRPYLQPVLLRLWDGTHKDGINGWCTIMIERGYGELSSCEKVMLLEKRLEQLKKTLLVQAANMVKQKDDGSVVVLERR